MRILKIIVIGLTILTVSCGEIKDSQARLSTAFDSFDFELVTLDTRNNDPLARTVGSITFIEPLTSLDNEVIYTRYCTGFKVSKKHFITNEHCMEDPGKIIFDTNNIAVKKEDYTTYGFGDGFRLKYLGEIIREPIFEDLNNVLKETIIYDYDLDFAIYELPKSQWTDDFVDLRKISRGSKSMAESTKSTNSKNSNKAALYSHPTGSPLTKSKGCHYQKIDEWTITHDCDSLSGSSGGLLIDATTSQPLGLHHQGGGKQVSHIIKKTGNSSL